METRILEGLSDTFRVVIEAAAAASEVYTPAHFPQLQHELEAATLSEPTTLVAFRLCLDKLATSAAAMVAEVEVLTADPESQLKWWAHAFARQCRDALDELTFLAPWTGLLSSPNSFGDFPDLDEIPTLHELAALELKHHPAIARRLSSAATSAEITWLDELQRLTTTASQHASTRIAAIKGLNLLCDALARMEYDFLFDEKRHLLAIGYHVGEHRRDASYYDLLASEARFSNFVAIAQGQLPQESWFSWDVCSQLPVDNRPSFRGVVRCSNT